MSTNGSKIGHYGAPFLQKLVRIHEFGAAHVGSEDGEEHGHERLVHVF